MNQYGYLPGPMAGVDYGGDPGLALGTVLAALGLLSVLGVIGWYARKMLAILERIVDEQEDVLADRKKFRMRFNADPGYMIAEEVRARLQTWKDRNPYSKSRALHDAEMLIEQDVRKEFTRRAETLYERMRRVIKSMDPLLRVDRNYHPDEEVMPWKSKKQKEPTY